MAKGGTMPNSDLDTLLRQNSDAPTNDDFARQMAKKLFPPRDQRVERAVEFNLAEGRTDFAASEDEQIEWCGEATVGLLEAVMASNLLSVDARRDIEATIADSQPTLEREKTIGHFHFQWTEVSSDTRDNTTETNIDATAGFLNQAWDRYTSQFRQPKANLVGGERIIDVEVYYNAGLHGSTSSHTNRIFLNSNTVVNDDCRRCTTSAHELFHRVEYAYGYVTGTAGQRWWVEALGSWSQEYFCPDTDDYITRVNTGLSNPARSLLDRSYDACHYWKYLGEQLTKRSAVVANEHEAIDEVLEEYASNGLDAKAASGTVTQNRIGRNFDRFFQDWSKANYIKDLLNPFTRYEYDEDENVTTSCGRTYGPYRHVMPTVDESIDSDTFSWISAPLSVSPYGTDYLQFSINPAVTKFSMRFDGDLGGGGGPYSTHLILLKDDRWTVIYNNSSVAERSWTQEFDAGRYDRCTLVVNGLANGGSYTVSVNSCITGVWRDGFNFVWTLTQSGSDISGTVQTSTCGVYTVTGTIRGNNVTLNASGACCDFTYTGTIEDCESGTGTWSNNCSGNGSWSMTKSDADEAMAALEAEEAEFADDPTTMRSP
jgi:hypothetical protein